MAALKCMVGLDHYYKEHCVQKVTARRRVEFAMDALGEFFHDVSFDEVNIPMCREYRDYRADVSDSTVRRELGVLQAAANHNIAWRRVTLDKAPSIELPPDSPPRRVWLYKNELALLLDTAETMDERVFHFVQIAYHTASRKHAIETLKWSQVDLDSRRVNLQGPGMVLTKKRKPIVPISETMASALSSYSTRLDEYVLGHAGDIRKAFDRVAVAAGIAVLPARGLREGGRLSPHILRHSRATHLLESGRNPWAVASLLGDTLQTVMRVYGHACPDYLEELVA